MISVSIISILCYLISIKFMYANTQKNSTYTSFNIFLSLAYIFHALAIGFSIISQSILNLNLFDLTSLTILMVTLILNRLSSSNNLELLVKTTNIISLLSLILLLFFKIPLVENKSINLIFIIHFLLGLISYSFMLLALIYNFLYRIVYQELKNKNIFFKTNRPSLQKLYEQQLLLINLGYLFLIFTLLTSFQPEFLRFEITSYTNLILSIIIFIIYSLLLLFNLFKILKNKYIDYVNLLGIILMTYIYFFHHS